MQVRASSGLSLIAVALLMGAGVAPLEAESPRFPPTKEEVRIRELNRKVLKYQKKVFQAHLRGEPDSKVRATFDSLKKEKSTLRERLF